MAKPLFVSDRARKLVLSCTNSSKVKATRSDNLKADQQPLREPLPSQSDSINGKIRRWLNSVEGLPGPDNYDGGIEQQCPGDITKTAKVARKLTFSPLELAVPEERIPNQKRTVQSGKIRSEVIQQSLPSTAPRDHSSSSFLPTFYVADEDGSDPDDPAQLHDDLFDTAVVLKDQETNSVEVSTTPASHNNQALPVSKRKVSPRDSVRKRSVMPSKNEVAKRALNKGQAHITPRGFVRTERLMGPGCSEKCKRCKSKLSLSQREKIFKAFWAKGNHTDQWSFIAHHVHYTTPKKSLALPGRGRQSSRVYSLKIDGKKTKVCKTMFLHTLGVVDSWVESALKKVAIGGNVSPDKRGKHSNRPNRTSEETKRSVHKHISLFPRIQSHYCRKRSKREYLETGLSIEKLYTMYTKWVKDQGVAKAANRRTYREIFTRHYNIGFFLPRKDQCLTCRRWKTSTPEEKELLTDKYETHLKNKEAVNKLKKLDKMECETNSSLCVGCFDLQKVLICPRSETSVFFYKNKLSVYNLTIFDLLLKVGRCYMWNETEAQRGANEVGSCLFMFIQTMASKGIKDIRLYSDAPTGQNRNRFVFAMFLLACIKLNVKITHRFLESGHSYSEVDSMHARIEKEAERKEIFSINEWYDLIKNAKQSGESYEIVNMASNILNFKALEDMQNWNMDTAKRKIYWSKVREVVADPENPSTLTCKYEFDAESFTVAVNQKRGRSLNILTFEPTRAYARRIPLKEKKVQDITDCMKQGAIPSSYHQEWNDLISSAAALNPPSELEVLEERSDADFSDNEND